MKKVPAPKVVTTSEAIESPLPPQILEALGELVGAAREGLLALSVGVGLGVVHELMECEVDEVVGPRGKWNPDRAAKRHGHEDGSMTLGGRRVPVRRPRVRTVNDEHELSVATYEYFADRDPLTRAVMDRMLAGVSTRKFEQVGEPVGVDAERAASSTSKTSVSEMFIEHTRTALGDLMSRRLEDVRLGLHDAEHERSWPYAAGSWREGMQDTLTLMALGITGQLSKTLCSTNPCESMIEIVRYTQRNVKRWRDGDMRKRWTAAGMLVAEQQFRRIIGYRHLATLVIAIERHATLVAEKNRNRQENRELVTV